MTTATTTAPIFVPRGSTPPFLTAPGAYRGMVISVSFVAPFGIAVDAYAGDIVAEEYECGHLHFDGAVTACHDDRGLCGHCMAEHVRSCRTCGDD